MAPNTQIGKIQLPYKVHDKEGHLPSEKFKFNRSREFSEDFTSKDWLEFGSRWLHLATYGELLDDIDEYIRDNIIFTGFSNNINKAPAVVRIDPNKKVISPSNIGEMKYVVTRLEKRPKGDKGDSK